MTSRATLNHGLFYLEGFWEARGESPSPRSSRPLLEMLERSRWNQPEQSFAHHHVHTVQRFEELIAYWAKNLIPRMPILVLAFPDDFDNEGATGSLRFGHDRATDQPWSDCGKVAKLIPKHRRGDSPFVVHFGTSRALGNPTDGDDTARRFLKTSGAVAASWYRKDVDWHDATALDLLWFNRLMGIQLSPKEIKAAGAKITRLAGGLAKELGFDCAVRAVT